MSDEPPFQRTVCSCAECVACCKRQPGPLAPSDVPRLLAALGEAVFRLLFVASAGAVVRSRAGALLSIGTITPRPDRSGRCALLGQDDRCSIHEVAPFGCAFFDTHMGMEEADRRSRWYLTEIIGSEPYARLRESLEPSALRAPEKKA